MKAITQFIGIYHFLSNFHLCKIIYEGIEYPSVEHAYQAAKTLDLDERRRIAAMEKPEDAKRAGRKIDREKRTRPDWRQINLDLMYSLVKQKFVVYGSLQMRLLATGDAELVEGNWWHDTFWGVCEGIGQNHLGKILMRIRAEVRRETA